MIPTEDTLKPMDWLRFPETAACPRLSARLFNKVKSSSSTLKPHGLLVCRSLETRFRESRPHTVSAVAHLLDWRLLNLHFHLQAGRSLPASCTCISWDDLSDSDHFGRDVKECCKVLDQVISKELILSHGGELEGYDQKWGGSDLHWLGASHDYLQHLVVLVKEVGSQHVTQLRNILT